MSQAHQVILTFDLDETKMQENAEKEAGRQIANMLVTKVFGGGYISAWNFKAYVQQAVKELMEEEREKVIQASIEEVAKALSKTKAVREKLAEVIDEQEGA